MTDIVFVATAGRMPDTWTEVVRALPADFTPGLPNLAVTGLEQYLDRQELRRVVLVGHGTGALAALALARTQPQRVSHLVLAEIPDTAPTARAVRLLPRFLLRRRGVDKQAMLDSLATAADLDAPVPTLVTGATYTSDAAGFVAEIREFLSANPA